MSERAKNTRHGRAVEATRAPVPKPPRITPAEQRRRFIEVARKAGASEREADFDRALGAIVKPRHDE